MPDGHFTAPCPLPPVPPQLSPSASSADPAPALARRLAALEQLVCWGLDIADTVKTLAVHAATGPTAAAIASTPGLVHAFDRAARVVRQCIWLQTRLEQAEADRIGAALAAESARTATRRTILRRVSDAIAGQTPPHRHDQLRAELHERLDDPVIDEDIARRELTAIVSDLRADLGLPGTGARPRSLADIATLHARAAARPSRHPAAGRDGQARSNPQDQHDHPRPPLPD